jgi:uncharacterized protein YecA (UPF0149 family)
MTKAERRTSKQDSRQHVHLLRHQRRARGEARHQIPTIMYDEDASEGEYAKYAYKLHTDVTDMRLGTHTDVTDMCLGTQKSLRIKDDNWESLRFY